MQQGSGTNPADAFKRVAQAATVMLAGMGALALAGPAGAQNPFLGDHEGRLPNVDARSGKVAVTRAQRSRVEDLHAQARWNRFGTPRTLMRYRKKPLAKGLPADPVRASKRFLADNAVLFKLRRAEVRDLEVLSSAPVGPGRAVLLRQRFGPLVAGHDGLIAVGVRARRVWYVSSSNTGDTAAPPRATLTPAQAWRKAAADIGVVTGAVTATGEQAGFTVLAAARIAGHQYVRPVAVPTPRGTRAAFEAIVLAPGGEGGPVGYTVFVDGRSGATLKRVDRVQHLARNPRWKSFPSQPKSNLVAPLPHAAPMAPTDSSRYRYDDTDIRRIWCWSFSAGCQRTLFNEFSGRESIEWDELGLAFAPSGTSRGNNADSAEAWLSPLTGAIGDPTARRAPTPPDPDREYLFPWTNQWNREQCSPSVFLSAEQNDVLAATSNLFAMHNRMHDWSYHLGFTEDRWNMQENNYRFQSPDGPTTRELDPEHGGAQAGAVTGGPPTFEGRDNANQITLNDGIPGVTNMYLWQPIAAGFYAPCTDGDYDMSIIGHEYTHAISNRMVAGPDGSLSSDHGGAMGESWSDLTAVEYLNEYGLTPVSGEDPFSVGSYVTDDRKRGIRNYNMSRNPLNLSDYGYDFTGPEVHSDGEIWDAVNFDIRRDMIARYNGRYPASSRSLQVDCANGRRPADVCPGNRRWIQLVFDAYLLMNSDVDMVDARNAYLAADQTRFGGANRALLWNAFARRGMGSPDHGPGARMNPSEDGDEEPGADDDAYDTDPVPSFESPVENREATVRFAPTSAGGGPAPANWEVFVGDYEARATQVADGVSHDGRNHDPGTSARFVPGTYSFVVRAPGFGHVRFTRTLSAGQVVTLTIPMPRNIASASSGATATGDEVSPGDPRAAAAIDDAEDTSFLGDQPGGSGARLTVDLPGTAARTIRRVRVSALPRFIGSNDFPATDDSRFSALRQFKVLTCVAGGATTCAADGDYTLRYTSPADAFPAERPRPRAPDLIIRSFDIPDAPATHVRLVSVSNQCSGFAGYHGEQDADPLNPTDCRRRVASEEVVVSEFQVLETASPF